MNHKTERIRAFLLEVGDDFIMFDRRYRVVEIKKGFINYYNVDEYDHYNGGGRQMSANSRQIIQLICKPKSPVCDH